MHKRIFSLMLVICLLLNVLPVGGRAFAAGSDDAIQYTASDQSSLLEALAKIETADGSKRHDILITNGFPISQTIVFPKGKNITLRGDKNSPLYEIS